VLELLREGHEVLLASNDPATLAQHARPRADSVRPFSPKRRMRPVEATRCLDGREVAHAVKTHAQQAKSFR
jgi:hypothetical protein